MKKLLVLHHHHKSITGIGQGKISEQEDKDQEIKEN